MATRSYTGQTAQGYCFLCVRRVLMEEVEETYRPGEQAHEGWLCPRCGGVSVRPHQTCPEHGPGCPVHPDLVEEKR